MKRWVSVVLGLIFVIVSALVVLYFFFPFPLYKAAIWGERYRAGLERKNLQAGDFDWKYLEGGHGETVILLHGFGGDKDHWVRMAKSLVGHYHVIAPDFPGFGESVRNPDLSYATLVQSERLADFIQKINPQPFHLVGNSMGGHIAAEYAARHPELVKSLVLISPGGVASAPASDFQRHIDQGDNFLLVKDQASFERLLGFGFYHRPFIPQPILRYLAERAIADQAFQQKLSVDYQKNSPAIELDAANLKMPILILWGDKDQLTHPQGAEILQALIPDSQKVILKDVGHVPMLEKPDQVAKIYLDFLSGLPVPSQVSSQ